MGRITRAPRVLRDDLGGTPSRSRWVQGKHERGHPPPDGDRGQLYIWLDKSLSRRAVRAEVRRIVREEGVDWYGVAVPLALAGAAARGALEAVRDHATTTTGVAVAGISAGGVMLAAVALYSATTTGVERNPAPPLSVAAPADPARPAPHPTFGGASTTPPVRAAAAHTSATRHPRPHPATTATSTPSLVNVAVTVHPPAHPIPAVPQVPALPVRTPLPLTPVVRPSPQCLINLDLKIVRVRLCV